MLNRTFLPYPEQRQPEVRVVSDVLLDDYGIRIVREGGKLVAEYDSGESAGSHLVRHHITDAQAEQAMRSEHDAYLLVISLEGLPELRAPLTMK